MRIVIDLQGCQQAGADAWATVLAQVQALLQEPHAHDVWLVLSNHLPATLAPLRAAFASLIPAARTRVYCTPAPDKSSRSSERIGLVRANFLANLRPDLVFAPALFDAGPMVGTLDAPAGGSVFAVGVGHVGAIAGARAELAKAALLVAATPAVASALHKALPQQAAHIITLDAAPAGAARLLLDAFAAARPAAPALTAPVRAPLIYVAPAASLNGALLAALARRYQLTVVVDAPAAARPALPPEAALQDSAWLVTHGASAERIVYHVGSGAACRFVLALFERWPGIVALHDFLLAPLLDDDAAFDAALLSSHGYGALLGRRHGGTASARAHYPVNRALLERASGVIVHDAHWREQGVAWYGAPACADWHVAALPGDAPEQAGRDYAAAIEHAVAHSAHAHYRRLLRALAHLGGPHDPRHPGLLDAAQAIAANQPSRAPRQLLVDISAVVEGDLKTGIQRVVRSIVLALIKAPPPGFVVEPVYGNGGGRRYRYARRFTCAMLGEAALAAHPALEDAPIEHRPGDIFLGLDLVAHCTTQNQALLASMRDHGVALYFVMYDLLPLLMPQVFPFGTEAHFRAYLHTVAGMADGVVCISRAVADELCAWLDVHPVARHAPLQVGYFHMGADLDASAPSSGLPPDAAEILAAVAARPTLLMVGTLEPRKGHAQALAAFDLLWSQGADVNLVIVGKAGWMVDALVKALQQHPQLHQRLFWLPGVSDEMLGKLYASASGLLAASVGEGFGLPLIESAQHGLPIVARSLTVFREIGGAHAYYFDGEAPQDLAAALQAWLDLLQQGQVQPSSAMPWLSWAESAEQLQQSIVHGHWYRLLPNPPARV